MRRPSSSSHTATKLAALIARWNPTRSQPASPAAISVRHGSRMNSSTGRERDVEEEADQQVRPLVAQHLGHELQVVVVDPHDGLVGRDLGQGVGEALVDRLVGLPVGAL